MQLREKTFRILILIPSRINKILKPRKKKAEVLRTARGKLSGSFFLEKPSLFGL